MAWNQPGGNNNNPWGKKPPAGGGDLDQAFKDWQKRIESLFGGGGGSGGAGGDGRSGSFMLVIVVILAAVWMLTGLYEVQPGNQGVVQRFGKHVETVGDGWGWRLPWPIETVTKVDVQGVKSVSYKSRVLTAEPNMVELQVAVQYRVRNAEDNLFKVRDPISTLGEVSESAIREVVGRNDQQAILEAGRVKIAEDTRVIMQRTLDQYGAGIEVRSVNITDVQVPEAVQQAQRDSVKAKADRERMIKEAQAIANGIIPQAEGRAAREVQEAEAYKSQIVAIATGEASRFGALLTAYEKAPNVTRERMYIESIENVLSRSRKVVVDENASKGNMLYLPLDKLVERGREGDNTGATMRPSVTVEAEPSSPADARQRVER
jgi:membrane protease subunit HflK